MNKSIGIIGGGAAGFFAAIQAAKKNPGADVRILESSRKPLAKVLVSGGGRCNVTNNTPDVKELASHYPRGSRELLGAFSRFSVHDTIAWFEQYDVELKTEPDKRMFPVTDCSETIADCLIQTAGDHGVTIETGRRVLSIKRTDREQFQVESKGGAAQIFDSLILATGGTQGGFQLAESLGHTIVPPVPSLFTFQIQDPLLDDLAGISFPLARLHLTAENQSFLREGPLLITHWGLSGPATIQLSALAARELFAANYSANLRVSFLPDHDAESVIAKLTQAKEQFGKKQIRLFPLFDLPKRFWSRIVDLAGIVTEQRFADCSNVHLRSIAEQLVARDFKVSGKGIFKEEFVTCGGVLLKEVDFKTLQSKLVPKLFFAGEVLDIDGITGGFNFQSAWTTGWIAGNSC